MCTGSYSVFSRTQKGRFPPPLFPAESYPYRRTVYGCSKPAYGSVRAQRGGREEEKGGCGGGDSYARIEGKKRRGEEGLSFPLLCSMLLRWANREVGERTIRWLYHSE